MGGLGKCLLLDTASRLAPSVAAFAGGLRATAETERWAGPGAAPPPRFLLFHFPFRRKRVLLLVEYGRPGL